MKERRNLGQEGFRIGGIHERRDPVKKGDRKGGKQGVCETGEMLDRRYTGKVECRTCGMEEEDWRVTQSWAHVFKITSRLAPVRLF